MDPKYNVCSGYHESAAQCDSRARRDFAGYIIAAYSRDGSDAYSIAPTNGRGITDQYGDAVPLAFRNADGDPHGYRFTGSNIYADTKGNADEYGNAAAVTLAHFNRVCLWNSRTDLYTFPDSRATRNGIGSIRRILDGSAGRRPQFNGG